uniref:Leucine-rich repeat-containing N-terminal plant-type domain-containing protein n=1 Tax=Oryza punctata TaxID=4537 RepID=A0A0E0MDI6_ORYPU
MAKSRHGPCSCHVMLLVLFVLFLHASMATAQSPQLSEAQERIMRNLSNAVSTTMWNWNTTNSNPCLWSGVICSKSMDSSSSGSTITQLSLSGFGLSYSAILASICSLDTLQVLDVSGNSFSKLPDVFTSRCPMMASLTALNLSQDQLDGPLSDFSSFDQLEVLDLSFNFLNGDAGTKLSSLHRLRSLNLSSNGFAGDIPTNMAHFWKNWHYTYGNLTLLDLGQNNLTGNVPDEFFRFSKLQILLLSAIPASLSSVSTLYQLAANQNIFSGLIPIGITKHAKLLDLSYNMFSGEIPSDLFSTPVLNGSIPDTIAEALRLAYLELDANYLVGGIPWQVSRCSNLSLLNLADNELQGPVPNVLGNLDRLVVLKLQMNNLDGRIPSTLPNMSSLRTLNLSHNSFEGVIPHEIFRLSRLSVMNFQGNKTSGMIPTSISALMFLIELNLGDNELTGIISAMPNCRPSCQLFSI